MQGTGIVEGIITLREPDKRWNPAV